MTQDNLHEMTQPALAGKLEDVEKERKKIREILRASKKELQDAKRDLKNLQTKKRQFRNKQIRSKEVLEKLVARIKRAESKIEDAQKKQRNLKKVREISEKLQSKRQQLLDEQVTTEAGLKELTDRIQETEQKKAMAETKIASLTVPKGYVTRQLVINALSGLAFFFMAIGIFLTMVGSAGVIWGVDLMKFQTEYQVNLKKYGTNLENSMLQMISREAKECNSSIFGTRKLCKRIVMSIIGSMRDTVVPTIKTSIENMEKDANQTIEKVEKDVKQTMEVFVKFLRGFGAISAIVFGVCWIWLERWRVLNFAWSGQSRDELLAFPKS